MTGTWALVLVSLCVAATLPCVVATAAWSPSSLRLEDIPEDDAGHWWPQGHPRRDAQEAKWAAHEAAMASMSIPSVPGGGSHFTSKAVHYTYVRDDNGPDEYGPANWGAIDTRCNGQNQSPIDIRNANYDSNLNSLAATWGVFNGSLVNNGHTIQVNVDAGNGNVTGGALADPYYVVQFHVHYNSEHTVTGASYPLELHIVHMNTNGAAITADASKELAVVAFFFNEDDSSTHPNPFFDTIIAALPGLTNNSITVSVDLASLAALLPNATYYTYPGSLTTPNCRETVTWHVLERVLPITGDQLDKIRLQFPFNNRPIQTLNTRTIRTNRAPDWGAWSACSATCGGGVTTRTCSASAGLVACTGSSSLTCNTNTCPTNHATKAQLQLPALTLLATALVALRSLL